MAEWSKAPDPSSGLFGGAGSNPAPVIFDRKEQGKAPIAAGLEPATVGSEVQRSSIEPRDRCAGVGEK